MNLIQKRIQDKQAEKEKHLKEKYCYSMLHIENGISLVKKGISDFQANRKHVTDEDVLYFIYHIRKIGRAYETFLTELNRFDYERFSLFNVKKEAYMTLKKQEYREEFESIYNNFKRIKGCNIPRRNEILGLMRKAFDFDSSKYHAKTYLK